MLILLSPAKSLDFETEVSTDLQTRPDFEAQAAALMSVLRKKSSASLQKLMKLSAALGDLNHERNQAWHTDPDQASTRPAVNAFQGDVYRGLDVGTLTMPQKKRLQKHVRILSGLYGVLRPFDAILPYRLEMGTKLKTKSGGNLYDFWGDAIRDELSAVLADQKKRLVVNLASHEYARAARLKQLDADVITPAFRDWKNGQYKMISFFAKKARGMMARYLITANVKAASGLTGFDTDGYVWNEELSTSSEPVFTRRAQDQAAG
ncbi:MAG: peroxide stress protein YaaA [Planctomycetaceae bacterium]|nr:peroxide stress protein YaaA [Planctomycetaceae bacterium]